MFRIITTFIRQDMSNKFFYEEYKTHPVVLSMSERFHSAPGHIDITIISEDDLKIEIAMNFESSEDFWNFAKKNYDVIEQRKQLVYDWCDKVNHVYGWRFEEVNT